MIDAILSGAKTVEVRRRPTRYRGEVLLHASRTYGPRELALLEQLQRKGFDVPPPAEDTLGAIVGRATITGCRRMTEEDWAASLAEPGDGDLWAWQLADAATLPPFPLNGHLGLFDVEAALVR